MSPISKNRKLLVAAIAIAVASISLLYSCADLFREFSDRRHARKVLSEAKTVEELKKAAGWLGAVFALGDNDWVAIRYVDSHSGRIYSCAVALDSKGRWFYSGRHFCGRFRIYQDITRLETELAGGDESKAAHSIGKSDPEVFGLANAANADEAAEHLLRLGFHQ